MLEELPLELQGSKKPVARHLFKTNEKCIILPKDKEHIFHHIVSKLLYLCWCTMQDIKAAVAFLCTRNPIHATTKAYVVSMSDARL